MLISLIILITIIIIELEDYYRHLGRLYMCASDLQGLNAGLLGSILIIIHCNFYLYMHHHD